MDPTAEPMSQSKVEIPIDVAGDTGDVVIVKKKLADVGLLFSDEKVAAIMQLSSAFAAARAHFENGKHSLILGHIVDSEIVKGKITKELVTGSTATSSLLGACNHRISVDIGGGCMIFVDWEDGPIGGICCNV